jgi:mono/diheme cytochrome c family protein
LTGTADAAVRLMRLLLIACLAACQAASAQDEPPATKFEHDMIVRFHMHENFDLVRAIEKLLVRGKLDEGQRLAASIARAPDEPGMQPWAAQAARVRERASAVATAPGIDEALRAEARLADACASCHADAGVVPEFRSPPPIPADRPTIEARMARHLWASDRLWEGIVGDADDSWRAGLDVLAATPLPAADRAQLGKQLQTRANDARQLNRTTDRAARARAYGEILVTCAACHAAKPK